MEKFPHLEPLDRLARNFLNTLPDDRKMKSLHFEERAYVATLANLYMMYDLFGHTVKKKCIAIKQKTLADYQLIHTELYFARIQYKEWIESLKKVNRITLELRKLIKNKDFEKAFEKSLELNCVLLRENTLINFYRATQQTPGITDQFIKSAINESDFPELFDCTPQNLHNLVFDFISKATASPSELSCFDSMTTEELETYAKRFPDEFDDNLKSEVGIDYINALLPKRQ